MLTRIAHGTLFRDLQTQLARLQRRLTDAEETVSSQKVLRRASDDPVAAARVHRLRGDTAELGALRQGVGFGIAVLATEDSALDQAQLILARAREIASQHAGGLDTVAARQTAAEEVEELERAMLALGNTTVGGRHVFGGLATGADPFASFDDPSFDPSATYSGPPDPFVIPTGTGETVRLTTPGGEVFGAAIVALDDLRTTLEAGQPPIASIDTLQTASLVLGEERASVGARLARLNDRDQELADSVDATRIMIGQLEDADITLAAVELVQLQHAYEVTLAAGNRLLSTSILDFMSL
jgi:flagellar hook-associated protein 3 FlgL